MSGHCNCLLHPSQLYLSLLAFESAFVDPEGEKSGFETFTSDGLLKGVGDVAFIGDRIESMGRGDLTGE